MKVNKFDFSHYYTYAELVNYLTQMAEDYPKLIDLQVLGKSYAGRDIWVAIFTNQVTGSPLTKPGYWIDANTHGGKLLARLLLAILSITY